MLLATLLLATIPMDGTVVRESVDLVEKNHYYDCDGREVFCQWIFYDWQGGRHQVVAWRMAREEHNFRQAPPVLTWSENGVRQIRGMYWRETWTQWDPEIADREILERKSRRGIFGGKE